ncbi:hypothetical protein [Teredinibacter sp. KSP-S5-2]|uniref:hypothetical protein n=1 Tax=Teredinibacter sp. KSP-S5-2 TaxID=3034506 RepID=UPI0029351EB7|nr:hypothetical protein [Teredinibacter sp. KSP-S5-2]WNO08396.1 hypothetical protein P5V12_15610 [Teredinibacter sp. KSP-S5-2]
MFDSPIDEYEFRYLHLATKAIPGFLKEKAVNIVGKPRIKKLGNDGYSIIYSRDKIVTLDKNYLSLLWSANYCFYLLFKKAEEHRRNKREDLSIIKDEDLANALILYNTAYHNLSGDEQIPWSLTKSVYPNLNKDHTLDRLFLYSIAHYLIDSLVSYFDLNTHDKVIKSISKSGLVKFASQDFVNSGEREFDKCCRTIGYIVINLMRDVPEFLNSSICGNSLSTSLNKSLSFIDSIFPNTANHCLHFYIHYLLEAQTEGSISVKNIQNKNITDQLVSKLAKINSNICLRDSHERVRIIV